MTVKPDRVDELAGKVRVWTAAGWSVEKIAQHLRDAGLSKPDATVAFARGTGTPRSDAIRIVHHCDAYADRKTVDEAWHEALWDLLEDDEFVASLSSPEDQ